MYVVWRRNDGYVASSQYRVRHPVAGNSDFEVLLETEHWADARRCIEVNRDDRHRACVASWDIPLVADE